VEGFEQGKLYSDGMHNRQVTVFQGKSKQGHNVLIKHYWYTNLSCPVKEVLHRTAHPNVCRLIDFSTKYVNVKEYRIDIAVLNEDKSN